jgi:hypothetical protein
LAQNINTLAPGASSGQQMASGEEKLNWRKIYQYIVGAFLCQVIYINILAQNINIHWCKISI